MNKEDISRFLRRTAPFSLLNSVELERIVAVSEVKRFSRGEVVCKEGEVISSVFVLMKGAVAIVKGSEPAQHISEGQLFPAISPISQTPQDAPIEAEETSLCIRIPVDTLKLVMKSNEDFSQRYALSSDQTNQTIAATQRLARKEFDPTFENYLAISRVDELLTRDPVTCSSEVSVREALDIMNIGKVGSIIVVDEDNTPLGIVTAKDFARLISAGTDFSAPISKVMSTPVVSVRQDSPLFNAYRIQTSKVVNHLVVVDELGKVKGIVTSRDLIVGIEPSYAMVTLSDRISTAETIEEIRLSHNRIVRAIDSMVNRGVGFYELAEIISGLNDVLAGRVLELATQRLKDEGVWTPVKFAWVVAGSGGRREQILRTDQDNAIIYDDAADEKDEEFLVKLSNLASDWLEASGMPKCSSGYVASNPVWRKSLSDWKRYFDDWMKDPVKTKAVHLSMFLDIRPVYGDDSLANSLLKYVRDNIIPYALRSMSDVVFLANPYIGPFGRLRYRDGKIDIKLAGLLPIVQFVKALAVQAKITVPSTLDRLAHLVSQGAIDPKAGEELKEAFQFLSILRLKHQLRQTLANEEVDDYLRPGELTQFDETLLKASFQALEYVPATLLTRFGGGPGIPR
ncbi:MAG: DUF294 nucleotidyltransferase-like domain-containing protein [archaeon]